MKNAALIVLTAIFVAGALMFIQHQIAVDKAADKQAVQVSGSPSLMDWIAEGEKQTGCRHTAVYDATPPDPSGEGVFVVFQCPAAKAGNPDKFIGFMYLRTGETHGMWVVIKKVWKLREEKTL